MVSRRQRWSVLAILAVLVLSAAWIWWSSNRDGGKAQIITLPDGSQYQLAGVNYGKKIIPPSVLLRVLRLLPLRLHRTLQAHSGDWTQWFGDRYAYDTPQLFAWFRRIKSGPTNSVGAITLEARLADSAGREGGTTDYTAWSVGIGWSYAAFPVAPRRSKDVRCSFYTFGANQSAPPIASVTFRNPLYGHFGQWNPEEVPKDKMAGDVEVRLENFGTGVRESGAVPTLAHGKQGVNYGPGRNTQSFFDVWTTAKDGTEWVTEKAELSDATGNLLASALNVSSGGNNPSPLTDVGNYRMSVAGTLWPDEAAWKLRLGLKRTGGHRPEELVTFTNVPVPKMSTTNMMRLTNGELVLTLFGRNPKNSGWSRLPETLVGVDTSGLASETAVDLVEAVTDKGDKLEITCNTWWKTERTVCLSGISTNAQTVSMTWSVQKLRTVEFWVKPPETIKN